MSVLRGALTNLGKYNEGELDYVWLDFPASQEEVDDAMKQIGIGEYNDVGVPYEEFFFTDWDTDVDWVNLRDLDLGEYVSIDEVNRIAERLQEIEDADLGDAFEAAVQLTADIDDALDKAEEMIFISEPTFNMDEAIGYHFFDELGIDGISNKEYFFDYKAYGRDIRLEYYPMDDGDPETAGEYWCGDENASDREIGEAAVDALGWDGVGDKNIERYFDHEKFGRDIRIEGRFVETDKGIWEMPY